VEQAGEGREEGGRERAFKPQKLDGGERDESRRSEKAGRLRNIPRGEKMDKEEKKRRMPEDKQ